MFYQLLHLGSSDYFKKEYGENLNFPAHLHQCFELITVKKGEMEICIDRKNYLLKAGECILIFPNQVHSINSSASEDVLYIFSPKLVQAYYIKKAGLVPKNNVFRLDRYLIDRLELLEEDKSKIELKGILYTVCSDFDKSAEYEISYSASDLLPKIFTFVTENYGGDCSLENLSRFLGYDYAYISRFFKKITGISYNSYVNIYRLNHAAYLLKNSDMSVLECSIECGYKSLRSFNRNFKEFYSSTPNEYRHLRE